MIGTGYTHPVIDGCTFEEFFWHCAQAFTSHDPDPKTIYRTRDVKYERELVAKGRAELDRLEAMSDADFEQLLRDEATERTACEERYEAERVQAIERLNVVLARVEAWEPPTAQHARFKTFMVEQLRDTIRSNHRIRLPHCVDTRSERIERLAKNLARSEEDLRKAEQRAIEHAAWVDALDVALPEGWTVR